MWCKIEDGKIVQAFAREQDPEKWPGLVWVEADDVELIAFNS